MEADPPPAKAKVESVLRDTPLLAFFDTHDHPALVLPARPGLRAAEALAPVWSNQALARLVGTRCSWLDCMGVQDGRRVFEWLQPGGREEGPGGGAPKTGLTVDLLGGDGWSFRIFFAKSPISEHLIVLQGFILDSSPPTVSGVTLPAEPLIPQPLAPDSFSLASPLPHSHPLAPLQALPPSELIKTFDWTKTPLGPQSGWSHSLKTAVNLCLATPFQSSVWWGPEHVLIYNESYVDVAQNRHPHIFGMKGAAAWAELWDYLGPLMDKVFQGQTVGAMDDCLYMTRSGKVEESYHCWAWSPIYDDDGRINGAFNLDVETTQRVIGERRLLTLRMLGEKTALAHTAVEYHQSILEGLCSNARDVPFAFYYSVHPAASVSSPADDPTKDDARSTTTFSLELNSPPDKRLRLRLEGTIGVPSGHPSVPPVIFVPPDLSSPAGQYDPFGVGRAANAHKPVVIQDVRALLHGIEARGFEDVEAILSGVVLLPIHATEGDGPAQGVLVLGLNPLRPWDKDYRKWIDVLNMQLPSSLAAVLSYESTVKRAEELSAQDRSKTAFFSNVSHELRTLLTLVHGPVEDCLNDKELPTRTRNSLRLVQRNANRLLRLVNSLLDFSSVEAGRLKANYRPIQIAAFTADLAALFRSAIESGGIAYNVDCQEKEQRGLVASVDPDMWEKIVFNLLGNAFKYTLKGRISCSLRQVGDDAVLTVEDTGIGIPPSELPKIFERFHRVMEAEGRSHEGSGIGLSFTQELVRLLNGSINVTSDFDTSSDGSGKHGSCFQVRVPLIPSDHTLLQQPAKEDAPPPRDMSFAQGIVAEANRWVEGSDDSEPSSAGSSSGSESWEHTLIFDKSDKILIVDDNADMRSYIRSVISPFCKVIEARDGQEGLDKAISERPNLVLSDITMPKLDGFELLFALRNRPDTKLLPIILLTARAGPEAAVDGLLQGADDYLCKPFRTRELIARVFVHAGWGKKRIQLEKEFSDRMLEHRTMTDSAPCGIFRGVLSTGHISYVNAKWHEFVGCPVTTKPDDWGPYIHTDSLPEIERLWGGALKHHMSGAGEIKLADGRWIWVSLVIMEELDILFGVVLEISDRKALAAAQRLAAEMKESDLRRRAEEAEQRRLEVEEQKRAQEHFIDVTSHEIRNPISGVLQNSELVAANLTQLHDNLVTCLEEQVPFTPTRELIDELSLDLEALSSIHQCSRAQERIANDILRLAQIELKTLQIHGVPFNVQHEARKTVDIFKNEAKAKGIDLALSFGDSLKELGLVELVADPMRIGQVMINLLSNAVRFTERSFVKRVRIHLDASLLAPGPDDPIVPPPAAFAIDTRPLASMDGDVYLYCACSDTGEGIDEKDQPLLFRRFTQTSASVHTVFGGSGLGLFVCRQLCELLGGRIEVVSRLGEGSTFRFYVRAQRVAPAPLLAPISQSSTSKRPKLVTRSSKGNESWRVLVVEDNPINATVLRRQLSKAGHDVDVATNGLEGLEAIKRSLIGDNGQMPYDCVLMDLEMPGQSLHPPPYPAATLLILPVASHGRSVCRFRAPPTRSKRSDHATPSRHRHHRQRPSSAEGRRSRSRHGRHVHQAIPHRAGARDHAHDDRSRGRASSLFRINPVFHSRICFHICVDYFSTLFFHRSGLSCYSPEAPHQRRTCISIRFDVYLTSNSSHTLSRENPEQGQCT